MKYGLIGEGGEDTAALLEIIQELGLGAERIVPVHGQLGTMDDLRPSVERSIVPQHRRLEIGSTWIAKPWRRTAINTEAKLLMLEHAFETLDCIRVEFMADALNEISRKAILRLGAQEEGRFRNYIITAEGEIHDAVYYSIIEAEWLTVKARLQQMLDRPYRRCAYE